MTDSGILNVEISMNQMMSFIETDLLSSGNDFDQQQAIPEDILNKMRGLGFFGLRIPKHFGGVGIAWRDLGDLIKKLAQASASIASLITVHTMVSEVIHRWGTDDQKLSYLPLMASGSQQACFALTEPQGGSDMGSMATIATVKGDKYFLNGTKTWISGAVIGKLFLVFAMVDHQPTAFLISSDDPCVSVNPIYEMFGFRAAMLGQINFNNLAVSRECILGKIGAGISHVANTALDLGRFMIAATSLGIGTAVIKETLEFVAHRKLFGSLLKEHQLMQGKVAKMVSEWTVCNSHLNHVIKLRKEKDPEFIIQTNIAKYQCSNMASNISNEAILILGAAGLRCGSTIARCLRDSKVVQLIEGTNELQEMLIAQYSYCNSSQFEGKFYEV